MKSTPSLWSSTATPESFASLEVDDLQVDVVVVGGGITGLTTALLLKRSGKRVALLEARTLGSGVTLNTSAHLTQIIDTRFHQLERDFGHEEAQEVALSSAAAIDLIEWLCAELGPQTAFARVPGFLFAETADQQRELLHEVESVRRAGIEVSVVRDTPLPFDVRAAMRVERQAIFNPGPYLSGLAALVNGEGSYVFERAPVKKVSDGTPCRVETASGRSLTCAAVVLATHSPLNRVLLQTKIAHYQSYLLSGPSTRTMEGLFWDMAEPYHYVRSFTAPDGSTHVVIGGEDHKTGQETETQSHFDALARYAERFQVVPTRLWSDQVVESVDGLPFIGQNAASKHVYVATGFSGNGLTFGTVAAMLISDAINGRFTPWHELYQATRVKPVAALPSFLAENVDFPMELVSTALRPAEAKSVREVKRGEGRIVEVGRERLAVYRDDDGGLHACASLCTHLGCRVAFNDLETTWDCPCHGSRFGVDGAVLAGPAVEPLEPRVVSDDDGPSRPEFSP